MFGDLGIPAPGDHFQSRILDKCVLEGGTDL